MKILRICLLLLLAVSLPLRGAIAAAMPCAGGDHAAAAAQVHAPSAGHHHLHAHGAAAGHSGHGEAHHHHDHAGVDKCNLCASCCSATSLPATLSLTVARQDEPPARFPVLQVSAPSFVSGGQERPPRSI